MSKAYQKAEGPVFTPVRDGEAIRRTAAAAREIWAEHYVPILGAEQTEYMIEKFQSEEALRAQIETGGYQYFLIGCEGADAGFFGIVPGGGKLFLSKLYVKKAFRRRGFARAVQRFLDEFCRGRGLSAVWLTVNRHNAGSIAAYEQMGFLKVRTQVEDIGGGYVMDDYIMERPVAAEGREN